MGETIIKLTPFIIGSAVVPVQVMIIILLLNSPRQGLTKAISLYAGMAAIRIIQGLLFGLILSSGPGESDEKSLVVSTLLFVLGILLLINAYKLWRNDTDPDDPTPKWMVMLDTISPLRVFLLGVGFVLISGKFWVFTLSAIGVIEEAQLGQPASTITFLLFILLAQSLLLLIILVRVFIPGRSKGIMENISIWLTRYNRPIVLAVSLIFGVLFLVQGVNGLLQ